MSRIFIKLIKIGLFALMPLFLTSSAKVEDTILLEKGYSLQVTGVLNQELKGTMSYETDIKITTGGTSFSTLELKLSNDLGEIRHSMGFLISQQAQSNTISVGTYNVAESIDGFLNDFDGVFGFADLDVMSDLPFFAQKGEIIITDLGKNKLEGSMVITLRNSNGKLIKVNGDFLARR